MSNLYTDEMFDLAQFCLSAEKNIKKAAKLMYRMLKDKHHPDIESISRAKIENLMEYM